MPTDAPHTISDLARLTGVSVRTIRYYLAQGLLPASGESGPGAHYGAGHLARLQLIRRLQQQHLPLAEIRTRLATLTDDEVAALAGAKADPEPVPDTSALDYVRAVLAGSHPAIPAARSTAPVARPSVNPPVTPPPVPQPLAPPASAPPAGILAVRDAPARVPELLGRTAVASPTEVHDTAPRFAEASPEPAPPSIERSQWERLSLGPNLELHVRRPLSRLEQKRVERLITIARQVLKEEQP